MNGLLESQRQDGPRTVNPKYLHEKYNGRVHEKTQYYLSRIAVLNRGRFEWKYQ